MYCGVGAIGVGEGQSSSASGPEPQPPLLTFTLELCRNETTVAEEAKRLLRSDDVTRCGAPSEDCG